MCKGKILQVKAQLEKPKKSIQVPCFIHETVPKIINRNEPVRKSQPKTKISLEFSFPSSVAISCNPIMKFRNRIFYHFIRHRYAQC